MRIVVVGAGGIGYALAEALAVQHDIVVVESNAERTDRLGGSMSSAFPAMAPTRR